MKQQKKTPSQSTGTSKSYFNPYETTPMRTNTSRTTYKDYVKKTATSTEEKPKKKTSAKTKPAPAKDKAKTKTKTAPAKKKASKPAGKVTNKAPQKTRTKKGQAATQKNLSPEQRRAQMRKKLKLTQAQRRRMRRRRQIASAFKIGLVMCLTIGIVWGGIYLKEALTKPTISTQVVKIGTLDTSTQYEGVVLRNEKVVYGEESGNARYVIAEGEKVNKDGLVYVLVDEENLQATTTAKEDLESEIYNQAENNSNVSGYQDERYNLDQEVKNKVEEFYNSANEISTNAVYTLRSQLESSIANRTKLYSKEQEIKNQELISLREQIEADLGNYQKGKLSTQSGIISYRMDGKETESAQSILADMTKSSYQKLKKNNSLTTLGQSMMNAGEPIYKIVLNNEWYIVSFMAPKEAEAFNLNQTYNIHFDDLGGQEVSFTVMSKDEKDENVQIVFKSNNQIGDFLDVRGVNFSIGEKAVTGLKIPNQALVELNLIKVPIMYTSEADGKTFVYRQKGEVTESVELNVQYKQDDDYYMIQDLTDAKALQVNDVIVNKETGKTYQVTEVETKQGVYVVNNKIAKFKEIEISAQSNEYAIVKYTSKSKLKEQDKIISNPKSIKMDQLLDEMKVQNE